MKSTETCRGIEESHFELKRMGNKLVISKLDDNFTIGPQDENIFAPMREECEARAFP